MTKVIYSKYNRERLPAFQTETSIFRREETLFVRKKACGPEGLEHVKKMYENYLLMTHHYQALKLAASFIEGDDVISEYINGVSIAKRMLDYTYDQNREEILGLLNRYVNLVRSLPSVRIESFNNNADFVKIFGEGCNIEKQDSLQISNIDLTFDNILINVDDKFVIIDYEWIFDFPIPIDYIIYRGVYYFWEKNGSFLAHLVDFDEALKICNINADETDMYSCMEEKFMNYVFGVSRDCSISEKYIQERADLPKAYKLTADKSQLIDQLEQENKQLKNDKKQLEKDLEIVRDVVENVYASASWKLTKPIRKIKKLFKKN